jgi:hypothetical protein
LPSPKPVAPDGDGKKDKKPDGEKLPPGVEPLLLEPPPPLPGQR